MEIYLIRHTTPQIAKGICYGQSDVPLAPSFHKEAKKVLTLLPENFDSIYSSPLTRCYELAKCIPSDELVTDERLLEYYFGQWEMKRWDEIDKELLDTWMKNFVDVRPPGGENFVDLDNRVRSFIKKLQKLPYKRVAIVTHAGVIRCIMAKVSGIELKDAFSIAVDYSSVTKITL